MCACVCVQVVMQRLSPNASNEILFFKLKTANEAIRVAERRAEAAEQEAAKVHANANARLSDAASALNASNVALRHAEEEARAASCPDKHEQARVRALEMDAHAARKTAKACCDPAQRAVLEEEATFQSALARQARHCLQTGTTPRAIVAHVYVGAAAKDSTQDDGGSGDLARLELNVALGRALDARAQTASGIGARHPSHGERVERFVKAVSADIQGGLEQAVADYDAAKDAGARAVRR